MKFRQRGVGRAELIVVIVILCVLAGAALPRKLSVASVAESAGAAMTVNYAGCATVQHRVEAKTCVRVTSCAHARQLLQGALPPGHVIDGDTGMANGDNLRCRVTNAEGAVAQFNGLSAGI